MSCSRQRGVPRYERDSESLGERHVGRIVDGEIVPELPDPLQQQRMWISLERQVAQVFDRAISTLLVQRAGEGVAPQDLGHFEIEQMRGVERLAGEEEPFGDLRGVRVFRSSSSIAEASTTITRGHAPPGPRGQGRPG